MTVEASREPPALRQGRGFPRPAGPAGDGNKDDRLSRKQYRRYERNILLPGVGTSGHIKLRRAGARPAIPSTGPA